MAKRQLTNDEEVFLKWQEESRLADEEVVRRFKETQDFLAKGEKELQQIQEDLNKGPRLRLASILEEKKEAIETSLKKFDEGRKKELDAIEERIAIEGKGYIARAEFKAESEMKRETLRKQLTSRYEFFNEEVKEIELEVKRGELKFLEKKRQLKVWGQQIYSNAKSFFLAKAEIVDRATGLLRSQADLGLSCSQKMKEIEALMDELHKIRQQKAAVERPHPSLKGKVIKVIPIDGLKKPGPGVKK